MLGKHTGYGGYALSNVPQAWSDPDSAGRKDSLTITR